MGRRQSLYACSNIYKWLDVYGLKSRGVKATITCVKNGNAVSYEGLSPRDAERAGREQVINEKITNYTTKKLVLVLNPPMS